MNFYIDHLNYGMQLDSTYCVNKTSTKSNKISDRIKRLNMEEYFLIS